MKEFKIKKPVEVTKGNIELSKQSIVREQMMNEKIASIQKENNAPSNNKQNSVFSPDLFKKQSFNREFYGKEIDDEQKEAIDASRKIKKEFDSKSSKTDFDNIYEGKSGNERKIDYKNVFKKK
ncbi:MAG: hypothetical protein LBS95_00110 [Mycoplasmataceae bacterium]|jgi:archaellin|nr:hypothetical protein [Mycoplasmataceae bacterium]